MEPGIGILIVLLGVLIVLFVGAALLRAAVAMANKAIGPLKPSASALWDWEAGDDDYDRPRRGTAAMSEPGIGQGMLILFLTALVQLVVTVVVRILFDIDTRYDLDDGEKVLFVAFSTLVGFGMMTAMIANMLPTTGKRAAVAALFYYLICLLLGATIGGLLYLALGSR